MEVYAQGIKNAPHSQSPLLKAADILERGGRLNWRISCVRGRSS